MSDRIQLTMRSLRSLALNLSFGALFCGAIAPQTAHATWYEEVMEPGADILMMDLRWPYWPVGTYYANWNTGFGNEEGSVTFYGGFISSLKAGPDLIPNPSEAEQDAYVPGNVWSWWGGAKDGGVPLYVDCAESLGIVNESAGEGCSASLKARGGAWPFMTRKRWYTQVARLWRPLDPEAEHSYCARWIKDVHRNEWHLVAILRVPFRAEGFGENKGFIEPFGAGDMPRPLDRRFGYYRKEGEWRRSNKLVIDRRSHVVMEVVPEGDHEYHAIEYAQTRKHLPWGLKGAEILPGNERIVKEAKQPAAPVLGEPGVEKVRAIATKGQVVVSWDVPRTATPFFAYKIEVFDNPECAGTPEAVAHQRMPNVRHLLIDVEVRQPTIRMTAWDIFDQQAEPVVVRAEPVAVPEAEALPSEGLFSGVSYTVHVRGHGKDCWESLDDIPTGKLVRKGLAAYPRRGVKDGVDGQHYGLEFEGFIDVPQAGVYLFHTQIDGNYRLEIDGEERIVRDRNAGTKQHSAVVPLGKGLVPFRLSHLAAHPIRSNFDLEWEGPGMERRPMRSSAFKVLDRDRTPQVALEARIAEDGKGVVRAVVDPRGHKIDEATLILSDKKLTSGEEAVLSYEGPLPGGEHGLGVRIRYDGGKTVDYGDLETLTVRAKPVADEWMVLNLGAEDVMTGFSQTGPGDFSFVGHGMHGVMKPVDGDFTVTGRINDYATSGVHRDAWVGLAAFERSDGRNWNFGKGYYVVQTSGDGLRASADSADLGGSRKSSFRLPEEHSWLRITRQGGLLMGWTSEDGKQWVPGGTYQQNLSERMHAGLFIRTKGESDGFYRCKVSDLVVEQGVADGSGYPDPPVAEGTGGDRLTGVVMADSDPDVVVVRSSAMGLGRTTDGGKTWRAINGDLKGHANAVRSVAIHRKNPDIMLRAAGRSEEGKLVSGLWKTVDGGKSWKALDFPGDFDGDGPSALCGEVLVFDREDDDRIFAGTESKGFFISEDGGETWEHRRTKDGGRYTSVVVSPWKYSVSATNCGDSFMKYLGRGEPAQLTGREGGRTLFLDKQRAQMHTYHFSEVDGFYNLSFSKMMNHDRNWRIATSHGLKHNYGGDLWGVPIYKHVEWMRPITAIHGSRVPHKKNSGVLFTQALDPETPGRVSRSLQSFGRSWDWIDIEGDVPGGGLIATTGELQEGEKWWFLYTDGLYFSPDRGETMRKVLSESGDPVGKSSF